MSPEVILAKARLLAEVLEDMLPHTKTDRTKQMRAHYEIERMVQVAVDRSVAIARRMIALKGGVVPNSARETFEKLHEMKILPGKLATDLALSVGMRNVLVHEYGVLDYNQLFEGLRNGHATFSKFLRQALRFRLNS